MIRNARIVGNRSLTLVPAALMHRSSDLISVTFREYHVREANEIIITDLKVISVAVVTKTELVYHIRPALNLYESKQREASLLDKLIGDGPPLTKLRQRGKCRAGRGHEEQMQARSSLRRAIKVGSTILIIGTLAVMVGGGYWENLPGLRHVSGAMRFRESVANPIPECVKNVSGGYGGFPFGAVITEFAWTGDLAACLDLRHFQIIKAAEIEASVPLVSHYAEPDGIVYRGDGPETVFLVVDPARRVGKLIVP